MKWEKGNVTLWVSKVEGCGKNYSLLIGKNNWFTKVASFKSDLDAENFCNWFDYMVGLKSEEVELKDYKKE